ncbi:MAG: HupE/UreJ family protein [Gammaproteobacteria bacterium]|nr:HupE/UreJ family protein [Gammaproteobacteria bacterium]
MILLSCSSLAHEPSLAYLQLYLPGAQRQVVASRDALGADTGKTSDRFSDRTSGWARLELALRDAALLVPLDVDGDGQLTWGEVKRGYAMLSETVLTRITLGEPGNRCELRAGAPAVSRRLGLGYLVIDFVFDCPGAVLPSQMVYALPDRLGGQHRALTQVHTARTRYEQVLSAQQPMLDLGAWMDGTGPSGWQRFAAFWTEGVLHLAIGLDHLLFLLTLLLALSRPQSSPDQHSGSDDASVPSRLLARTVVLVTTFSIAHSLSLCAAVLGPIELPARFTESAIAASVVLAALHNLRPIVGVTAARLAFGLGLLHGLGFARAFAGLDTTSSELALSLAGFNLGVESGQLVVVLLALPLVHGLRSRPGHARMLVPCGSWAVAVLGGVWLVERAFELRVL